MVHGDDNGLVLPPHVAPVECRIIPIAQHKEGVLDRAYALLDELKKAGYRKNTMTFQSTPPRRRRPQHIVIPQRSCAYLVVTTFLSAIFSFISQYVVLFFLF